MAEIVQLPNLPLLNERGQPERPLVLLYGMPSWQAKAVRGMEKVSGCVIKTDVRAVPNGPLHPVEVATAMLDYFSSADVVLCWCGEGQEVFYLDHWTYLGVLIGKWPQKVVIGMKREQDHPMVAGLELMLQGLQLRYHFTLDNAISVAQERCRELRRIS